MGRKRKRGLLGVVEVRLVGVVVDRPGWVAAVSATTATLIPQPTP